MKTYNGLSELISACERLPLAGWIFVDKNIQRDSESELIGAKYYVPENDDDEFYGEDNLLNWLEVGIFRDVLLLRKKRLVNPSVGDYAAAAVHYVVNDDFLE